MMKKYLNHSEHSIRFYNRKNKRGYLKRLVLSLFVATTFEGTVYSPVNAVVKKQS